MLILEHFRAARWTKRTARFDACTEIGRVGLDGKTLSSLALFVLGGVAQVTRGAWSSPDTMLKIQVELWFH